MPWLVSWWIECKKKKDDIWKMQHNKMNETNHSHNKHTHKLNDNYKNNERLIRTRCFKEQECKKQSESERQKA